MKEKDFHQKTLCLKYIPSLNAFTKSREATLILAQLEYWFSKYHQGFYKFFEPCPHPLYRKGDSWEEEIGFSRKAFNRAFEYIGIRYRSKSLFLKASDKFQGKLYASYYDRKTNRTYFVRNHGEVTALLKTLRPLNSSQREGEGRAFKDRSCNGQNGQSFARPRKEISSQKTTSSKLPLDSAQQEISSTTSGKTDQMIEIWKKEVGEQGIPLTHKNLVLRLGQALETFFQGCLEKWRAYCRKIASSKFLMGEKTAFKAWLSWVIKPEVYERIEKGDFDIGDRQTLRDVKPSLNQQEILDKIETQQAPEIWKSTLRKILSRVGEGAFTSWFLPLEYLEQTAEWIRLKAPTRFAKDYIETRYAYIFQSLGSLSLTLEV